MTILGIYITTAKKQKKESESKARRTAIMGELLGENFDLKMALTKQ